MIAKVTQVVLKYLPYIFSCNTTVGKPLNEDSMLLVLLILFLTIIMIKDLFHFSNIHASSGAFYAVDQGSCFRKLGIGSTILKWFYPVMECISALEEREEEMLHRKQSDKRDRKPQLINSHTKKVRKNPF